MNTTLHRRRFLQAGAVGLLLPAVRPLFALADTNALSSIPAQAGTDCTDWLTQRLQSRTEVVRLPAGNFSVSRSVDITGLSIAGAGADLTRLVYTGPGDVPFLSVGCSPSSSAEVRDLSLVRADRGGAQPSGWPPPVHATSSTVGASSSTTSTFAAPKSGAAPVAG